MYMYRNVIGTLNDCEAPAENFTIRVTTVKLLKNRIPKKISVIILEFEQYQSTTE